MSLPVILRRQAQVEFDDAADWYEQRRLGRGVAFTVAGFDTKFAEMRRWLRRAGAYLLQSTVFLNFVSKPPRMVKIGTDSITQSDKTLQSHGVSSPFLAISAAIRNFAGPR